ncbi:MAG: hypothetical protein ACJAUO_000746 [Sediminicola sp.]|jgi:hypothetical protein
MVNKLPFCGINQDNEEINFTAVAIGSCRGDGTKKTENKGE